MKKKICFPFIGDSFGGSHKSTLILIKQLQGEKIETIIFLHKKGKLYEILKSNKIKFYFYPIKNYFGTSATFTAGVTAPTFKGQLDGKALTA